MSMPIIKPSGVKRCEAVSDIIASVALQQTGLSHILNAEGEKIQAALVLAKNTDELLKVNDSVKSMVNSITRLETVLQGKLELFNNCICDNCECVPSALTFDIVGGGIIKDGKEPNTYIFTGNKEENIITFVTNPNVVVTSTSALPKGVTFLNNVLTIPADFDYSIENIMTFMIGEDNCKYEITITTSIL